MNGTIELTLPKSVDVSDFEIKMIVAAKLYELGKLSSGQGAEVVGLSKRAFLELLGKYNVSVFGYDEKELEEVEKLSVEERKAIVKSLRGIAAVEGKTPPTDEEIKEDYTNYLIEKYK